MNARALLLALALAACQKSDGQKTKAAASDQGTIGADGLRHIAIEAGSHGYDPDEIHARPNEKLVLVFTRTVDSECLSQVKIGDGPLHDLPMNQPVDVPVTAPASGKLTFVCGMDMQTGTIVAKD